MSASALKRRREAVRAAKLALLKIEAQQRIDRTDASARKVEEALAAQGRQPGECSLSELDAVWDQVKSSAG